MFDVAERPARRGAHALGRRIGCGQLRVRSLQLDQLPEEPVVLGIGHLRRILFVVQPVGAGEDVAQLGRALLGLLVHRVRA